MTDVNVYDSYQPRGSFKRNGPTNDEIEIIGIEFAIRPPDGSQEVELQMFSTSGLIIPRSSAAYWGHSYQPRITFHANIGDYTMIGGISSPMCPW